VSLALALTLLAAGVVLVHMGGIGMVAVRDLAQLAVDQHRGMVLDVGHDPATPGVGHFGQGWEVWSGYVHDAGSRQPQPPFSFSV
jgi:hypothetical protein